MNISPELESILKKLSTCQDPATGATVFLGTIKVAYVGETCFLLPEDYAWETESGAVINTKLIKEPAHESVNTRLLSKPGDSLFGKWGDARDVTEATHTEVGHSLTH